MFRNVLGAQAHFSTTQILFSSSSDPKTQPCCFRNIFSSETNILSFQKCRRYASQICNCHFADQV